VLGATTDRQALAAKPSTGSLVGRSALVVDDNETNRQMLGRLLNSWGMSYTDVATPAAALELLGTGARPVPPYTRVVEASTWLKDRNSRSTACGAIPIPVSHTVTRSRTVPSTSPFASSQRLGRRYDDRSTSCGATGSCRPDWSPDISWRMWQRHGKPGLTWCSC